MTSSSDLQPSSLILHPFKCTNCGRPQPITYTGWKCPVCGGLFTIPEPATFNPQLINPQLPGVWRYRRTFPLPAEVEPVSLGEGNTPLIPATFDGRTVSFKLESQNPTGSYKDRGMAVMFAWLKHLGAREAIEDSSGNAGASFAGYAARAGIRARVFVPAAASGPKRKQIEAYGAELIPVDGPRSKVAQVTQAEANVGAMYASHIFNPLGITGQATVAFEIFEQLGRAPENIVLPIGHGLLLLGLQLGFLALKAAGLIETLPRLIGVQAMACAPLWALHTYGREGLGWVTEGATLAEGIRVLNPVRGDYVLNAVRESGGTIIAVEEEAIATGQAALARLGLYVEPTSAVVWEALGKVSGEAVVILTGNGLKSAL
ncbi:MAG: threonine synthase [Anaerolineales bacterium]